MTFFPNPGFEAELTRELTGEMQAIAERVASAARAIAPVVSGDYLASIHVETIDGKATVVAGTDHAIPVEFGTYKDEAQHIMSRDAEGGGSG